MKKTMPFLTGAALALAATVAAAGDNAPQPTFQSLARPAKAGAQLKTPSAPPTPAAHVHAMQATLAADGTVHVVCEDEPNPKYRRFVEARRGTQEQ
jgi:hypothetical protein